MTPKQALEILIKYVQNHSCCGRVPETEREAIRVLRLYFIRGD